MKNTILKELWKAKDSIAKAHNYDVEKLANHLIKKENKEVINVSQMLEETAYLNSFSGMAKSLIKEMKSDKKDYVNENKVSW